MNILEIKFLLLPAIDEKKKLKNERRELVTNEKRSRRETNKIKIYWRKEKKHTVLKFRVEENIFLNLKVSRKKLNK